MKLPTIIGILLTITFTASSQENSLQRALDSIKPVTIMPQENAMQRALDSIKTLHAVCMLKDDIKFNSNEKENIFNTKKKLSSQLQDIERFKTGRTDLDKDNQLSEINALIQINNKAIQENSIEAKLLIDKIKIARDHVSKL